MSADYVGKCFRDTKLKELFMDELFKSCVTFVLCDWFEYAVQHRVPLSKFIKNVFTKGQEWNWIIEKCDDFFPLPSSFVNTFSHFNKSICCCKAEYAASTANYIGKAKLIEYFFGQNELFAGIESVWKQRRASNNLCCLVCSLLNIKIDSFFYVWK